MSEHTLMGRCAQEHARTRTHTHICAHMHTSTHTCAHTVTHIHTHMCTHSHTHIQAHTGSSPWLFQLYPVLLLSQPLLTCFSLSALYFLWELRPPLCDQRYRSKGRAGGFGGPPPSSSPKAHHLRDPSNTIKATRSQAEA